jgi:hypothetical protein
VKGFQHRTTRGTLPCVYFNAVGRWEACVETQCAPLGTSRKTKPTQHESHTTSGETNLAIRGCLFQGDCARLPGHRPERTPVTTDDRRAYEATNEIARSCKCFGVIRNRVGGTPWAESLHGSHVRREKFDDGQLPRTPKGGTTHLHDSLCAVWFNRFRTTIFDTPAIVVRERETMWTKETPSFGWVLRPVVSQDAVGVGTLPHGELGCFSSVCGFGHKQREHSNSIVASS